MTRLVNSIVQSVRVAAALASLLVLAGCGGPITDATEGPTVTTTAPARQTTDQPTADRTADATPSTASPDLSPAECARAVNDTDAINTATSTSGDFVSVTELYARIGTVDCRDDRIGLYYVSANGTWYHAGLNGSVGAPAPTGNDSEVAPAEFHLKPSERPAYVWRLHRGSDANDCPYTHFYDAASGRHLGWIPVTCPTPTPRG